MKRSRPASRSSFCRSAASRAITRAGSSIWGSGKGSIPTASLKRSCGRPSRRCAPIPPFRIEPRQSAARSPPRRDQSRRRGALSAWPAHTRRSVDPLAWGPRFRPRTSCTCWTESERPLRTHRHFVAELVSSGYCGRSAKVWRPSASTGVNGGNRPARRASPPSFAGKTARRQAKERRANRR